MATDNYAVIDMGTNTFHLLIAKVEDRKIVPLRTEKRAVRIGHGGIEKNIITEEAVQRAEECFHEYRILLEQYEVKKSIGIATSAFRNARNGKEIATMLTAKTGIEIEIIDGNKEAEYISAGVCAALDLEDKHYLIVDIGGGSVEFIILKQENVLWKKSYEIGGLRLIEKFHKSDPILENETDSVRNYLEAQWMELCEEIKKYPDIRLIGSSGCFDTLTDLNTIRKKEQFDSENKHWYELNFEDFHYYFDLLTQSNRSQRLQIPGMIELRVDMIVVAMILTDTLLKKFKNKTILCCTYALKEGVFSTLSRDK